MLTECVSFYFTVLIEENRTGKLQYLDNVVVLTEIFIRRILDLNPKGREIKEGKIYIKLYQDNSKGRLY